MLPMEVLAQPPLPLFIVVTAPWTLVFWLTLTLRLALTFVLALTLRFALALTFWFAFAPRLPPAAAPPQAAMVRATIAARFAFRSRPLRH